MADPTTIYDVLDTAVKIMGGALIGGGFTYLADYNKRKNALVDVKRKELRDVVLDVETFHSSMSLYWAKLADAIDKRDAHLADPKKPKVQKAEVLELREMSDKFFNNYTLVHKAQAMLSVINAKDCADALSNYIAKVGEFFEISDIEEGKCTEKEIDKCKARIMLAKADYLKAINAYFEKNI